MSDLNEFRDDTIEPGMRQVLPTGDYVAQAEYGEIKTPKRAPGGKMAVWTFRILHGVYEGRRLLDYMTLRYPGSPDAEYLAKVRLKTFSHAAIGRDARNTEELLFKPVVLRVIVKEDEKFGTKNAITDYRPMTPGTRIDARLAVIPGLADELKAMEHGKSVAPTEATTNDTPPSDSSAPLDDPTMEDKTQKVLKPVGPLPAIPPTDALDQA